MKKLSVLFFTIITASQILIAQKPELIIPSFQNSWIKAIKITPNQRYLVSAAMDRSVKIYDLKEKREVFTFWKHETEVTAIAIGADNRTIITGDYSGLSIVWDLNSGKELNRLKSDSSKAITAITISPNQQNVLIGDAWGYISEFEIKTGKLLIKGEYHRYAVNKIMYTKKGEEFFSISYDNSKTDSSANINVFHIKTSTKEVIKSWFYTSALFRSAYVGPESNIYYPIVADPNQLRINAGSEIIAKINIDEGEPFAIDAISTDKLVVACNKNEKIAFLIFDIPTKKFEKVMDSGIFFTNIRHFKMEFLESSNELLFINGFTNLIYSTHLKTGETRSFFDKKSEFQAPLLKEENLFLAGEDNKLKRWNLSNNQIDVPYSSTNKHLEILGAKDINLIRESKKITIWDETFKKQLDSISVGLNFFTVKLSPDSTKLAFCGPKINITIYDLKKRAIVQTIKPVIEVGRTGNLFDWLDNETIVYMQVEKSKAKKIYVDLKGSEREVEIDFGKAEPKYIQDFVINKHNGESIIAYNGFLGKLSKDGSLIRENKFSEGFSHLLKYDQNLKLIIATWEDGNIYFIDPNTLEIIKTFNGHKSWVSRVTFSKDYSKVVSFAYDNTIKIWNFQTGKTISTLSLLDTKEWVVVNDNDLFDASPKAMKYIYYVVNDSTDAEEPWKIIELEQLKHRYYQPDLLQIQLGYKKEELRQSNALIDVPLAPKINLKNEQNKLLITIRNQGGGIGEISVFIGNAEVLSDIRPEGKLDSDKKQLELTLDLNQFKGRFKSDEPTAIKVVGWNKEEWIRTKPAIIEYLPLMTKGAIGITVPKQKGEAARLFGLVIGTSDYSGQKIDLHYAAKDAADFAQALGRASSNLFGANNVVIELLTTDNTTTLKKPTRKNILNELNNLSLKLKPTDIVVVYLSGHGVNYGGSDGDFYYLTQDASGSDVDYLADKSIRNSSTISSTELTTWLNKFTALKKIMILDACASGKAAEKMYVAKDLPASQIRALDRMQDRTGFYILAGSAADAFSYEATLYGQGLLTYSILQALRGAALRQDAGEEYVDIYQLFQYTVDKVPELSKNIGGIQKPFFKSPDNQQSFDIGKVDAATKQAIILSEPKPVFIESAFTDADALFDELELSEKFNAFLQNKSAEGKSASLAYMRVKEYPGAYRISCSYTSDKEFTYLKYRVILDKKTVGEIGELKLSKQNSTDDNFSKLMLGVRAIISKKDQSK